ncbi:MAG: hypothetical protein WBG69_01605, partial [Arcobacteraceae bacterium]
MKKLTINLKLMLLISGSLLLLSIIILSISVTESIKHTQKEKLSQLKSITEAKKQHVSDYFKSLDGLLISTANSSSTQEAMTNFIRGFYTIADQSQSEVNMQEVKKEMIEHYEKQYLQDVNFDLPNVSPRKTTAEYLPKDSNALLAQYMYIIKNDAKIGEKNNLIQSNLFFNNYAFSHT